MFANRIGAASVALNLGITREKDTGLVRLFHTEFNRDYRYAKKHGALINDQFVKTFLEENGHYQD